MMTKPKGEGRAATSLRKHAPGGGRKPSGPFAGKSKTFTTRITPDTQVALAIAAKKAGVSIAQHAEYLLRMALHKPSKAERRNQALALAVASLAEAIERETKTSWRDDPFTGLALLHGIGTLILHFTPMVPKNDQRNLKIPPAIEAEAATMPAGFAERFRTPEGVGLFAAHAVGAEIKTSTIRPDQEPSDQPSYTARESAAYCA